ncbi:hypothetical protein COO60DRAFT_510252 [Scenedesmus sp. NREL 46B-D3]|nr:hypothetical protein COO60DRAFT_510252 [Scenedesmus sp. NREL 46B-D3]
MSNPAVLPMASAAGKNQFERERLARIAMIEAKMKEIMEGADTSLIKKQPSVLKAKASGPKKRKVAAADGEVRRSSRIHNMPVPLYCIEEDLTDGSSRSRRCSTTPGSGNGANGRRCHGAAAAAATYGGMADPYMLPPLGWKSECGSASLAAAEAATDAALALVRQLGEQGRPAVVKLMSASQVSGGFWCQLPIDLGPYYGTDKQQHKRMLTLHCYDKAQQDPDDFMHARPGSSTAWPVVHLPKGESSCGLSGGWRGFAIDQRIFPNDTVVFACLDNEPAAPTAAAAAASGTAASEVAAKQASSAAGAGSGVADASRSESAGGAAELQQQQQRVVLQDSGAVTAEAMAGIKPGDRMHLQAYIFRACDYEGESSRQQLQLPATPQQAADAAALGRMGSLTPSACSQPQQQQQHVRGSRAAMWMPQALPSLRAMRWLTSPCKACQAGSTIRCCI